MGLAVEWTPCSLLHTVVAACKLSCHMPCSSLHTARPHLVPVLQCRCCCIPCLSQCLSSSGLQLLKSGLLLTQLGLPRLKLGRLTG